jgi:putative transposase
MTKPEGIRTGRHRVFAIHVHMVFVTKFRHHTFGERHLTRIAEIMHAVCADFEAQPSSSTTKTTTYTYSSTTHPRSP